MAAEYTAQIETFVPTLVVSNWKGTGRQVRINADSYDHERDGEIISGPTQPPSLSVMYTPLKNLKINDQGRRIADKASPMHRA